MVRTGGEKTEVHLPFLGLLFTGTTFIFEGGVITTIVR